MSHTEIKHDNGGGARVTTSRESAGPTTGHVIDLAAWAQHRRSAAIPVWQREHQEACDAFGREIELSVPGVLPESPHPPAPGTPAGARCAQTAATWLEDLFLHKWAYKHARYRWDPAFVRAMSARLAQGRTGFTTLADLRRLQDYKIEACTLAETITGAIGTRAAAAFMVIGDYETIADALGMTVHDVRMAAIFGCWNRGEPTAPDWDSDPDVNATLRQCAKGIGNNILVEAWELRQKAELFRVIDNVFEDATVDLIEELTGSVPERALVEASSSHTTARMHTRMHAARRDRGEPGDPRRIPNQFTGPGAPLATGVPAKQYWRELQPWDLDYVSSNPPRPTPPRPSVEAMRAAADERIRRVRATRTAATL